MLIRRLHSRCLRIETPESISFHACGTRTRTITHDGDSVTVRTDALGQLVLDTGAGLIESGTLSPGTTYRFEDGGLVD